MNQGANPILDQIQNLDKQQQEQDTLVDNYYKAQFENKQSLSQKLSQSLNLLENKEYYGTNNPQKLFQRDLKYSKLHNKHFQFTRYRRYNQQYQKDILYKQLKDPNYNNEHDILTKQQRLSKIYTQGFKLEDMMTPREKRIHLQTVKSQRSQNDSALNFLQYRATTANDQGTTYVSQLSQSNLDEELKDKIQDIYINRDPNSDQQLLNKQQTIVQSDFARQNTKISSQFNNSNNDQRRLSKKIDYQALQKEVEERNRLKNLKENPDLTLDQLQQLRQKMLAQLYNNNQSVSSKSGIISNLFESELKDGNKKVYQEKMQIQREKQKQEMLSRQQAFNSFYNLLALNNKSKKKIFKKQIQNNQNQGNSLMKNSNQEQMSTQSETKNVLSRFQINSNMSGKLNIKNAQSKIQSGISKKLLNKIVGIDEKSKTIKKKEVLYINPYTNQIYTNHD